MQRTKRVDDTQDLLLEMLENLTSGTEQEKQEFMAICVETLKRFKMSDVLTPIFVFERLCNIIRPVSDLEDKAVEWYGCVCGGVAVLTCWCVLPPGTKRCGRLLLVS